MSAPSAGSTSSTTPWSRPTPCIGPGGEGGVMRIKGTGTRGHERGLAMALDGNGRWAYLDPKLGAMHAVAEVCPQGGHDRRKPVAATNCLNFGNPEKPEIMAQLSAAIDGIAEACTALGTPITGGNVSLYNETRGEGIYPTPVLGIVGILDDVTKAVPAHFQAEGDAIVLLWPIPRGEEPDPNLKFPWIPIALAGFPGCPKSQPDAEIVVPEDVTEPKPRPPPNWPPSAPPSTPRSCSAASGASRRRSISTPKPICTAAGRAGRREAAPLRPRHLRRRHRCCPGAGRISQGNRRHRRAGSVAHGSSALRPLRRTGFHHARHRPPLQRLQD
jgi:hypothetical protein